MIRDALVEALRGRYPDRPMTLESGHVRRDDAVDLIFRAAHPAVGDLIIADDGDEATVFVGGITHGHFGCYEDGFSEEQRAKRIADEVVAFVDALFADRVLLWTAFGGGGWKVLGVPPTKAPSPWFGLRRCFVWSGPFETGAVG